MSVQMDNPGTNKSYSIVAAMGALSLLGIVEKTKLLYFEQGHSHCDGDGDIGTSGATQNTETLPTYESYVSSIHKIFPGAVDVERIIGITDYREMFIDIQKNPFHIHGNEQC
jgi:hypothetical protein